MATSKPTSTEDTTPPTADSPAPDAPASETPTPEAPTEDLSPKARAEKRRAERQALSTDSPTQAAKTETTVSQDKFENPDVKALTSMQTATDAFGTERVVSYAPQGWQPAPLEASDEEKEAATKREKLYEDARQTRLDQAKGEIKPEDTATNDPGQGGSQEPPAL